jgi:membrane fusion protein, heavy metal efflux system
MRARSYPITHFRCCLAIVGIVAGCRAPSAADDKSAPDPSLLVATTPKRTLLRVHPSLLTQGRVVVADVVTFAHAGATLVPGEIAVAPDGEAEIGSLVNGRVASLEAVEGNTVKRGQTLAWIDSPEVGALRADLLRASGQVGAANKRWERQLALQAQGATSQSALDEANASVLAAQADQQAANARLQAIGVGGAATSGKVALRSPIDGVVVERRATLGAAVASDALLFRVINPRKLLIKAHWAESLGPLPPLETSVDISLRRPSNAKVSDCTGVIVAQLGLVDVVTRSVTLQIEPHTTCPAFSPGSYVDVLIGSQLAQATPSGWTQVPSEAVVDLRGMPTVFVATQQAGEFEVRNVVPGNSLGTVVPIQMGLSAGEKVVTVGTILLKGEALADILGAD